MDLDPRYLVRDVTELAALYNPARERSLRKQLDRLDQHCRAFIAASPLLVIGTQGTGPAASADTSPRGDGPGFVKVVDDKTLLIPDRPGNNRLDNLRNVVENPVVGLLFIVPGISETLRVNGEAAISRDPALLELFAVYGKLPRTLLVVTVKEAYMHCSKALLRAELWNPAKFVPPGVLPSFGTILAAHTGGFVDAKTLDEENRTRTPQMLY